MSLWDLLQLARQRMNPQAGQTAAPAPSGGPGFLESLMAGNPAGYPAGFDRTYPGVMGMEGSDYYPAFRFGYSGTPALDRLGVTQGGGMPPGLAMQIAQSQYFAPGSDQGQYLGARPKQQAAAPAAGGNKTRTVRWPGYGVYFSPQKVPAGANPQDIINDMNQRALHGK